MGLIFHMYGTRQYVSAEDTCLLNRFTFNMDILISRAGGWGRESGKPSLASLGGTLSEVPGFPASPMSKLR